MQSAFPAAWLDELVRRRKLADVAPVRLGGGNVDRRNADARTSWKAVLANGTPAKLTLAGSLSDYRARSDALRAVADDAAPLPYFLEHSMGGDVLAEEFIAGTSLDQVLAARSMDLGRIAAGLTRILNQLASAEEASSPEARADEWQRWSTKVATLACWDAWARRLLRNVVLPRLETAFFDLPPTKRWIHGDLIGRNILVTANGDVRLIDPEFATCTHFTAAEGARFYALTPGAHALAPMLGEALPLPDSTAELYFWVQQVEREAESNRPEYLDRWLSNRVEHIRRLALEANRTLPSADESRAKRTAVDESAPPIASHIEEARWLIDSPTWALRLTGWCHAQDRGDRISAVLALVDDKPVATALMEPRADVQSHFGEDPRALNSGFVLHVPPIAPEARLHLAARFESSEVLRFWSKTAGDLPGRGPVICHYRNWAEVLDPDPPLPNAAIPRSTKFTILLPVYNTPAEYLSACLDAVRAQHYPDWELRVVDDASPAEHVAQLLEKYRGMDPRVRVQRRTVNGGISQATNDALAAAEGEFVVFIDHDDLLRPHALSEFAEAIAEEPEVDALYSDEDKIDEGGHRAVPLFKPAFSPEFLRGVMYVGHALCVRTAVARATGGFNPSFDGVQDYEFFLRVTERTSAIRHLPHVLYHWRQSPGSSALHGNVKGNMDNKQALAVAGHLARISDPRVAEALGGHRVGLKVPDSWTAPKAARVKCAKLGDALPNLISSADTSAEILVLVSVQVAELSSQSERELLAIAAKSDTGCVVPVLVSPQRQILESGCTIADGKSVPMMCGFDADGDGFHGSLLCNREVAMVTPWCVAIRRELVVRYGRSATSWGDFCEKLRAEGLFLRVCAGVQVTLPYHWLEYRELVAQVTAAADAYYNPHFSRPSGSYALATQLEHSSHSRTPLVYRLEAAPEPVLPDGFIVIRGWAFHLAGERVQIRASVGGLDWRVNADALRPDVSDAFPAFTRGMCGFAMRMRVPSGRHLLRVTILSASDTCAALEQKATVPRFHLLHRFVRSSPRSLLASQLMAAPYHAPAPRSREVFPTASPRQSDPPRIALVTPSYQQSQFLRETMESVLGQNVECQYVVQDGGSNDGSVELIQQHATRLYRWSSARDAGQADAIAKGFAETSGRPDDVMAWINSDDFYVPGALRYVSDYFAAHPDVDVVYGHRILVDETSRELGRWFLPPHNDEVLRVNDFVPQETMFWRRRIWDKVGGIDTSFKFAMDWDLLLRFQAAGAKIVRVPYFLACFRIHSAQKTSAQMESIGQKEIDALRLRTFGRVLPPAEIEDHPALNRYLRKSAWIEFLWRTFKVRHR